MQFGDIAALLADDEYAVLALRQIMADGECVDRFDLVHESRRQEEIERTIYGGWRRTRVNLAHVVKQRISLRGAARSEQQFQHLAADRRELFAAFTAIFFRQREGRLGGRGRAMRMLVAIMVMVVVFVTVMRAVLMLRAGRMVRRRRNGRCGRLGVFHPLIIRSNPIGSVSARLSV